MWPWGHLAVAYLLYSFVARRSYGRPPAAPAVLAAAVGSQFPDLIDKPLGWTFGILPGGRTFAHSLFFAAGALSLVLVAARALERREVGLAFAIGHLSHLVADLPPGVVRGDLSGTTYLLWPVLEPPAYESTEGILEAFLGYSTTPYGAFQIALVAVALVVWYRDRMPGLEYAGLALERAVAAAR